MTRYNSMDHRNEFDERERMDVGTEGGSKKILDCRSFFNLLAVKVREKDVQKLTAPC